MIAFFLYNQHFSIKTSLQQLQNMARHDGRTVEELRKITITYERLNRVDGSARFSFGEPLVDSPWHITHMHRTNAHNLGETETLASVSGPIEVRPTLELPSQATLDIQIRPLASVPGTDSRALASVLKNVLTPSLLLAHNPRTLVQLVGQALCGSDSGAGIGTVGRGWNASLVASLINASSAAFINASSIPMSGVVCAVAVGRLPLKDSTSHSYSLVLDPSEPELSQLKGGGCFAFLFSSTVSDQASKVGVPSVALLWRNYVASNGTFDEREFAQAQAMARKGAEEVWNALKASVSKDASVQARSSGAKEAESLSVATEDNIDDDKMEI